MKIIVIGGTRFRKGWQEAQVERWSTPGSERLGHQPTVAPAGWPSFDADLAAEDSVTAVVQVAGKLRDKFDVSPSIDEHELRGRAAGASREALGGRDVRKIIVRAPKLVNVFAS